MENKNNTYMMISSPNFYLKGLNHLHLSFSILSIWTPLIILVPQHMFIKIEAFVEYTGKLIFLQPCNLYCTLGNNKDNALPNLVDTMQYINVCLLELKVHYRCNTKYRNKVFSQPNKNKQYKQTFIIQQICNNHCILYNTHTKHFLFVNWKEFFCRNRKI
jgi:hypothetical protein